MAGRAIPDDAPIRPRAARGPGWLVWQVLSHLRRPRRCTGLAPAEPRPRRWAETQRNDTLALVADHAALIHDAASRHRVPGEAVGGVILWEGLENPARRRLGRFALGKVRPTEFWRPAESQLVEREGRVPGPVGLLGRVLRLRQPEWAIEYIAAILGRQADVYEQLAGYSIRDDVAVLCTLYQGGDSEMRALRLASRRRYDVHAAPVPGDDMGPWVAENVAFVRSVIATGSRALAARCSSPVPSAQLTMTGVSSSSLE